MGPNGIFCVYAAGCPVKALFRIITIFALLLPAGTACEKAEADQDGGVEIYLLAFYETIGEECAIELSSVVIEEEPLVPYEDIRSYNSKEHEFRITSEASSAIESLPHSVTGLPFAVTADREIIYTGYFWPAYSSATCQWIVIDPLMLFGRNKLRVQLGYPGPLYGVEIPDERNQRKILKILRSDGKLLE